MAGPYVNIRGYKEISGYLSAIADELEPVTTQILAETGVQVMKDSEPPQRDVTRAEAYPGAAAGPGWQSDKQRRYVMAMISSGEMEVPYQRTGEGSAAWHVQGSGESAKPVNNAPGMRFTQSPTYQSNHEKLVGWLTTTNAIRAKMDYILDEARRRVAGYIEQTFKGRGPLT